MKKHSFLSFAIVTTILSLFILSSCQQKEKPLPILGDVHNHADFKVYLNGIAFDFAREKYMSSQEKLISNFIHLHDMDGSVIHQHMSGITLKDFFESLGMQFSHECFVTNEGVKYCNEKDKTLKMFVNGRRNNDFGNYEFKDLDRILITYGNEDDLTIQKQIESVTDKSCIQSAKCPERGKPSDESTCVAGGAVDCLDATGIKTE